MALIRTSQTKKVTEDILWTLPGSTLVTGNVNLSSAISNYDIIRVYYTVDVSSVTELIADMPVSSFMASGSVLSVGASYSNGTAFRGLNYVTDQTANITTGLHNQAGTPGGDSTHCIIKKISGLK